MQATIGYANTTNTPMEIGNELKVGYLLTGIYQVVGDRIRVDVELVDVATGNGIWQEPYNKLISDIFKMQTEIASLVLNKFNLQGQVEDEIATKNLEAYGQYLLAIESTRLTDDWTTRKLGEQYILGKQYLHKAIALDSSYIDAWVSLIETEANMIWFGLSDSIEMVSAYVEEFNRRFPDSWKNDLVRGFFAYHGNQEYDQGMKFFKEVLIHDPENFLANLYLGVISRRMLQHKKGLQFLSKALQQHPHDLNIWDNIGFIYAVMGDIERAHKAFQKSIELGGPDRLFGYNFYWGIPSPPELIKENWQELNNKLTERNYDGAFSLLDSTSIELNNIALARLYWLTDQFDSARYYAALSIKDSLQLAESYAILGNKEEAISIISERIEQYIDWEDYVMACYALIHEIKLLCMLGDYEEATDKLIAMNKRFPQFGDYGHLNYMTLDKAKKEYLPFLDALNNLKLPEKLVHEDIELQWEN
jgi:tetratricopeptide (TPR) repeat protein